MIMSWLHLSIMLIISDKFLFNITNSNYEPIIFDIDFCFFRFRSCCFVSILIIILIIIFIFYELLSYVFFVFDLFVLVLVHFCKHSSLSSFNYLSFYFIWFCMWYTFLFRPAQLLWRTSLGTHLDPVCVLSLPEFEQTNKNN